MASPFMQAATRAFGLGGLGAIPTVGSYAELIRLFDPNFQVPQEVAQLPISQLETLARVHRTLSSFRPEQPDPRTLLSDYLRLVEASNEARFFQGLNPLAALADPTVPVDPRVREYVYTIFGGAAPAQGTGGAAAAAQNQDVQPTSDSFIYGLLRRFGWLP